MRAFEYWDNFLYYTSRCSHSLAKHTTIVIPIYVPQYKIQKRNIAIIRAASEFQYYISYFRRRFNWHSATSATFKESPGQIDFDRTDWNTGVHQCARETRPVICRNAIVMIWNRNWICKVLLKNLPSMPHTRYRTAWIEILIQMHSGSPNVDFSILHFFLYSAVLCVRTCECVQRAIFRLSGILFFVILRYFFFSISIFHT